MKMEAITQETRLLCRNHIDTAEQLCSYKGSLETEMSALLQKRKELYSKSRRTSGEEKEAVKAELSDISGRLKLSERRSDCARASPPVVIPSRKNCRRYGQTNTNSKERS